MEKNEKQKKTNIGKILGGFLLIAFLLFLVGGSIFFRIRNVVVTGSELYTGDEVLELSGVSMGDHLFFLSPSKISANLMSSMSYAQAVQVSRQLPDTLTVEITEAIPTAVVISDGKWVIDRNCKILSKAEGNEKLVEIRGLELDKPAVGRHISLGGDEKVTAQLFSELLRAMVEEGMDGKVSRIEAEGTDQISFVYEGRLDVVLGSAIHSQEKLRLMTQVLGELEPEEKGTLDLSVDGEARFVPKI